MMSEGTNIELVQKISVLYCLIIYYNTTKYTMRNIQISAIFYKRYIELHAFLVSKDSTGHFEIIS